MTVKHQKERVEGELVRGSELRVGDIFRWVNRSDTTTEYEVHKITANHFHFHSVDGSYILAEVNTYVVERIRKANA